MKMKVIFNFAVLLAVPAIGTAEPPASRPEARVIRGAVVDTSGAAIVGAAVRLLSAGAEQTATADVEGRFTFEGVPSGPARVAVAAPGFAPVEIEARDGKALRIVLRPRARSEEITVRAAGVTVSRTSTATRTDTALRDVPQSIGVVTRALIDDQGMRGMADVIRYVPGVGIAQGEGNRDTPIFRGNSSTSDFFVDGIRDDVQYFRDLYNVERVEALKGPNAMMFGRGGVGGVINRVSRQADWVGGAGGRGRGAGRGTTRRRHGRRRAAGSEHAAARAHRRSTRTPTPIATAWTSSATA